MRVKARACWKVRTSPAAATACGGLPPIGRPSKRTVPRSGRKKPATRLNSVVLPAPFGPISAVIEPRPTSRMRRRPPQPAETLGDVSNLEHGVASLKDQLLLPAEDALRPERHQRDQDQPDEHEAEVGALGRVEVA